MPISFDLFWPDRPKREISGALLEPWIVELGLTSEIFNDIDRCKAPILRDTSKSKTATYHAIRAAAPRSIQSMRSSGNSTHPPVHSATKTSRTSAIVAEVKDCVTRDGKLLAKAPEILETFDLQLLSPVEFVSRLDSIEREQEYQPSRPGASSIITRRLEPH